MSDRDNILCIDYGLRRWGFAIANRLLSVSLPLDAYSFKQEKEAYAFLGTLIKKHKPGRIVIGNPIRLNGTPGQLCENILKLQAFIETEHGISVVLWDERLSSCQANRSLSDDLNLSRKQRTGKTDSLSAMIILGSFLDTLQN